MVKKSKFLIIPSFPNYLVEQKDEGRKMNKFRKTKQKITSSKTVGKRKYKVFKSRIIQYTRNRLILVDHKMNELRPIISSH